jgi:imidazolonepropionase-like amidohydrolase
MLTLTTRRFFDGERFYDDRSTAITIRGDRIKEVSVASNQGEASADARQLDASSLTLLPGLIDAREPGRHLKLIIRGGEIVMNRLTELPT